MNTTRQMQTEGRAFPKLLQQPLSSVLQSTVLCPLWREGWFSSLLFCFQCRLTAVISVQKMLGTWQNLLQVRRIAHYAIFLCEFYFHVMYSLSMTNIDPNWTALVADRLRHGRFWRKEFLSRDGVLTTLKSRNFIFNVMETWKFFLPSWEGESLLKSPKPAKQWVKDSIKLDGA